MPIQGSQKRLFRPVAGLSIRHRIIAGLTVILLAFAGLTLYSIFLHSRTVSKITLINSAYLPLTRGTAEIRSTQMVFNTLMDRLSDNPTESVTREWIDAWRRFRPSTLERLSKIALDAIRQDISGEEVLFLTEIRRRLLDVRKRYIENESQFQRLYYSIDTGQVDEARSSIENMKRIERNLDRVLRGVVEEVDRHITSLAKQAEQDGNRATLALTLLTLVTLIAAGAVIVLTNNLLSPLKALGRAVAKVAEGDLKTHITVEGSDEIGKLAAGFNRMTQALAERDQMLIRSERLATAGKMAAQVTHEIRNPLSSLGLNAELLEEELTTGLDKNEARSLLKAMQDEIGRLTGITESYLRFARMPSPEPRFEDINDVVGSVLEFMKSEIGELGISVETDLATGIEPILFDRGQIRQALTNLIKNACEAMPKGGVLSVLTRKELGLLLLTVSDTGIGIPQDALEHIFDSFYSTKSGGTGLGLPLVRQICLAHGGNISYESKEGPGSTFVMRLPIAINGNRTEVP